MTEEKKTLESILSTYEVELGYLIYNFCMKTRRILSTLHIAVDFYMYLWVPITKASGRVSPENRDFFEP